MRHTPQASAKWEPTTIHTVSADEALDVVRGLESVTVLTGAGVSTNSGIPDYRGPKAPKATPMMFDEFMGAEANRQRYWARSYLGWARTRFVAPNAGHEAIAAWERDGVPTRLVGLITQNVDGLHERAGSTRMVALHGRIGEVICMNCHQISARADMQRRLEEANPDVDVDAHDGTHAELRPDGDAVVESWEHFQVPACLACGGILKPHVVFFGESAERAIVAQATDWVQTSSGLVVVGSSLSVMSGLRFVRLAHRAGKPVVIVNHGHTRGDDLATHKVDADVSDVLTSWIS